MKHFWFSCAAAACLVAAPVVAVAQPVAPVQEVVSKHVGVGYKIGNGLGFVGGDLIIAPNDHVAFNLQANWFSASANGETATGFGLAPGVQFRIKEAPAHPPTSGSGTCTPRCRWATRPRPGQGGFLNAGYEWRFPGGFGILLGGGLSYLKS